MTILDPPPGVTRSAAVLLDLVDCVCTELTAAGGEPCWCGLWPGLEVSWEYCGECSGNRCGMGWVRLASVFPYTTFPVAEPSLGCRHPLAWQIEVGALRCLPQPADGGIADPAAYGDVVIQQMQDTMALYNALACCSAADIAAAVYQPTGPQGGCVGGFWTAFVAFD